MFLFKSNKVVISVADGDPELGWVMHVPRASPPRASWAMDQNLIPPNIKAGGGILKMAPIV